MRDNRRRTILYPEVALVEAYSLQIKLKGERCNNCYQRYSQGQSINASLTDNLPYQRIPE